MSRLLAVGIIGVGAIGQTLARAVGTGQIPARLVALADRDRVKAETFASTLTPPPAVLETDDLITRSDLVIEAAHPDALAEIVPKTLERRRDLLVLSVGGLLGHDEWFDLAERRGCRIYFPSGALAGLDGIRAACRGEVWSVTLTSRKPVKALRDNRYLQKRGIDLEALEKETVVFEGSAREACRAFPTTANVAAALSLSGIGPEKTRVTITAVPEGSRNIHEVTVEGDFGRLQVIIENIPSALNPRTSRLAALSALATLREITSHKKTSL